MTKDERIAELKESLGVYGRHDKHCPTPFKACDCGWIDVLKRETMREAEGL